jgi:hypothetical protein
MRELAAILVVGCVVVCSPARAQTPEQIQIALNNVQHEFSTCVAYFMTVATCANNRSDMASTAKSYQEAADRLLGTAYEVGNTIGMTKDAMESRLEMEAKGMINLMQKNCVNISSVMSRHTDRCVVVNNNPDAVLKEYMAKTGVAKK